MKRLAFATLLSVSNLFPMTLQAYPIDCAILLCLSGGWPASAPCAAAKAEFIRRITPIPVEPPLQIWRCPMRGAAMMTPEPPQVRSYAATGKRRAHTLPVNSAALAREGALDSGRSSMQHSALHSLPLLKTAADLWADPFADLRNEEHGGKAADIDISGPEFDFVRSIRVFQTYAHQHLSGRDDEDCNTRSSVRLGSYGTQGAFRWSVADLSDLPETHGMPEGMGTHCPSIFHRSVFVDWQDYEGRYGSEQVNY